MPLHRIYFVVSEKDHHNVYIDFVGEDLIEKVKQMSNLSQKASENDALKFFLEQTGRSALKHDEVLEAIIPAAHCDECGKLYGIPDFGWYKPDPTGKRHPMDNYETMLQEMDCNYNETTWSSIKLNDGYVVNVCEDCYCEKTDEEIKRKIMSITEAASKEAISMTKKIKDIHTSVDMVRDIGKLLNDSNKEEEFIKRRDFAHNLVRHFATSMHVNIDAINWCDPKKALPKWSGVNILFATKELLDICDEPSLVLRGTYSHERKKFMVADAKSGFTGEEYSVDEVACWMFVPCPIDFSEN